jgi:hypothetical protein
MLQRRPSVMGRHSKFSGVQGKRWDKKQTHENLKVGAGHKLTSLLKTNGELFAIPYEKNGGVVAFHRVDEYVELLHFVNNLVLLDGALIQEPRNSLH